MTAKSKLTAAQVAEIRALKAADPGLADLSHIEPVRDSDPSAYRFRPDAPANRLNPLDRPPA